MVGRKACWWPVGVVHGRGGGQHAGTRRSKISTRESVKAFPQRKPYADNGNQDVTCESTHVRLAFPAVTELACRRSPPFGSVHPCAAGYASNEACPRDAQSERRCTTLERPVFNAARIPPQQLVRRRRAAVKRRVRAPRAARRRSDVLPTCAVYTAPARRHRYGKQSKHGERDRR